MRNFLSAFAAFGAIAVSASAALAATGNVPFTGVVTSTCVLTVGAPGVLVPSTDFTHLHSQAAGGSAGTIAVLSTGTVFKVSAVAPTAFTSAPANGGTNVSFSATYAGSGATTIGTTPGATLTSVNPGTTNLSINLDAAKSAGTFDAGAYVTEVVVRCE